MTGISFWKGHKDFNGEYTMALDVSNITQISAGKNDERIWTFLLLETFMEHLRKKKTLSGERLI